MEKAMIFNIQRFSLHDGPGFRTTVFFKGCPLICPWCANPESQKRIPELEVFPDNCIGCGECLKTCVNRAISFREDGICIDRQKCKSCGSCAHQCYSKTLKYIGEEKTVEEVVNEIKKDEIFYRNSGGGYTFSGGEPLLQGEFCLEVIKECKPFGYHSAMETCGYGNTETLVKLAQNLDLIFFDLKHMSGREHKIMTGVSNELILENLHSIQSYAKEVVIRTPIIPGYNDSMWNIKEIAEFCKKSEAVKAWELLPYHQLGKHKYEALGREYELTDIKPPMKEKMKMLMETANKILIPEGKTCKLEFSGLE